MKRPQRQARHKLEIEAIRKFITVLGGTCNVLHQSGRLRGSAGIPDLYIQLPEIRLSYWHEVKVGTDVMSKAQAEFLQREFKCRNGLNTVAYGGLQATCDMIKSWRPQFWERRVICAGLTKEREPVKKKTKGKA